jgi:hypothetical protein
MSNRTQSGGDTYYCVDTLVRRMTGTDNLAIICPFSTEGEPLQVRLRAIFVSGRDARC